MLLYFTLGFLLLLYALKKFKIVKILYFRELIVPAVCILFVLLLMVFSKTAVTAAVRGLNLWLDVVLPSLLPFLVVSEILGNTGFINALGILLEPVMRPLFNVPGHSSFTFVMGITSGYPVGARITASMRNKGLLTRNEADRLIAFTNNSGPLFIIGAVATSMLKAPRLGILLLVSHIASCCTVGFLFKYLFSHRDRSLEHRYKKHGEKTYDIVKRFKREIRKNRTSSQDIGTVIGEAISNSVNTLISIGGFIILFSVIINLLYETGVIKALAQILSTLASPFLKIDTAVLEALLGGMIEITTGVSLVSNLASISLIQKAILISFIIGWAGVCIHFQVLSIVSKTDISLKYYFAGKFLQAIISCIFTWILFLVLRPVPSGSITVFAHEGTELKLWSSYFWAALKYLVLSMGLLSAGFLIAPVKTRLAKRRRRLI